MKGILGRKIGMTSVFAKDGRLVPVTVIEVEPNIVSQIKTKANDGYEITDVLIDGKSVGVVDSYKLEKVTSKHTIEVKTAKVSAIQNVDDWAKEEMAKAEEKGLIPETFSKKDATKAITRTEFAAVASSGARQKVKHGVSAQKVVQHCLKKARRKRYTAVLTFGWKLEALASRLFSRYAGARFTYRFCKRPNADIDVQS